MHAGTIRLPRLWPSWSIKMLPASTPRIFVHLCRWHPGKINACTSKQGGGQKSRVTYQDSLRKGLRVEALLLLVALVVVVVGVAGRHDFLRRVGAAAGFGRIDDAAEERGGLLVSFLGLWVLLSPDRQLGRAATHGGSCGVGQKEKGKKSVPRVPFVKPRKGFSHDALPAPKVSKNLRSNSLKRRSTYGVEALFCSVLACWSRYCSVNHPLALGWHAPMSSWHKQLPLVVFPCLFNGQEDIHALSVLSLPPPKRNHHRSNSP